MSTIRVKFLSRAEPREWRRYFPADGGVWGRCAFDFDRTSRQYDWLVVYDDVPPPEAGGRHAAVETLACPRANTVLVTTEPESIKAYGRAFAAQFGHVVTSQPAWALPHPKRHHQQAANHWFYGIGRDRVMSHDQMRAGPAVESKLPSISVVHSTKRQRHTLHARRYRFIEALRERLPEMAVFGRGFMPLDDKAEALAPFRYHLAVENHVGAHHITEKLTDALLGRCLCFYAGAPNANRYLPEGSFVPIDLADPDGAADAIRAAIDGDLWRERLPLIETARRLVLDELHLFAVVGALIEREHRSVTVDAAPNAILGRHAWRKAHPIAALALAIEKIVVRTRSACEQRRPAPRPADPPTAPPVAAASPAAGRSTGGSTPTTGRGG